MNRLLSFVCVGIVGFWTSAASALESGGFTLETGSPDALCPDLEATREIVARRLGSLIVEGRKGWLARYTIGHAPDGNPRDFVRLELFNPEGGVELRRDLPMEGDSCRTMSEVIALVLDRYFRGLVATEQSPPGSAPIALPPSRPAATVPTPARVDRKPATVAKRPLPLTGRSPRLSVEYAATPAQPYLGLRLGVGLQSWLEAGLAVRWDPTTQEEGERLGAHIEARTWASRANLAWRIALPPGLLHFGPALSLAVQRATTSGLQSKTDRTRALWAAGAEAGFLIPFASAWFVEGTTSLDFMIPGAAGQFLIDNHEVLAPKAAVFGGALGFGYVWGD